MDAVVGPLLYLLFVIVLPAAGTWGAVALLSGAFRRSGQPRLLRVLGAVGLLLTVGLLVFATATGSGYAGVVALEELIVASAAGLVGAPGAPNHPAEPLSAPSTYRLPPLVPTAKAT